MREKSGICKTLTAAAACCSLFAGVLPVQAAVGDAAYIAKTNQAIITAYVDEAFISGFEVPLAMQVSGKLITREVEPYYGGDNEITYPYDAQGRVVTMLESNESSYSFEPNRASAMLHQSYP